jgi:hypothetical protein
MYKKIAVNKSKFIVFTLCVLCFGLLLQAQKSGLDNHSNTLKKISNKKTEFFVTDNLNAFSDHSAKDFYVVIVTPLLKKIAKKYGGKMIPSLVKILQEDTTRDMAADILLYAITKRSGVALRKYYSMNKGFYYDKWRLEIKQADIEYWKEFMQKTAVEEMNKIQYTQ